MNERLSDALASCKRLQIEALKFGPTRRDLSPWIKREVRDEGVSIVWDVWLEGKLSIDSIEIRAGNARGEWETEGETAEDGETEQENEAFENWKVRFRCTVRFGTTVIN